MAKMAKKIQTDYTRGGRDVSNTAVPYWQNALGYANDYLSDPKSYINSYLEEFYDPNSASQRDFNRQYLNTMSRATANNYASTHGGYSSAGQKSYADLQRNENDLYARMREQGISGAANMVNSWYGNLLNTLPQYQAAYGAGKEYSDIQQYNNLAKQNNAWTNQVGQALPAVGSAIGSIWGPVGSAIGGAAGGALGGAMTVDVSSALGGSSGGSAGVGSNQWSNLGNVITGASSAAEKQGGWGNLFHLGNKTQSTNNSLFTTSDPMTAQVRRTD